MRSIAARFYRVLKENKGYSTYTAFAEAVRGQRFGTPYLRTWFNALVDKDDYARKERDEVLRHVERLNSIEG